MKNQAQIERIDHKTIREKAPCKPHFFLPGGCVAPGRGGFLVRMGGRLLVSKRKSGEMT